MIGTSKAWFCGMDGTAYELTGQGGSWFPQYGKNFTYTGEYVIVPEGDSGDWKVKFLTSGTFTATDALLIDVFAVGGGASGGGGSEMTNAAPGGGSGYTKTEKSIYLEQNKNYEIIIGTGGAAISGQSTQSNSGGTTSGFNVTVNGGTGPTTANTTNKRSAGSGGSGGGGALAYGTTNSYNKYFTGGSDGSDGLGSTISGANDIACVGGTGQGSTTREFGEESGDLYAGGGGGGIHSYSTQYNFSNKNLGGEGGGGKGQIHNAAVTNSAESGTTNTGGGGGGAVIGYSGAGGSGILIIRNHRE